MEKAEYNERPKGLGGSIPVRNVQELASHPKELTAEILERYIRPEINGDDCLLSEDPNHSDAIPVIDLSKLLDPNSMDEEVSKLKFACEDWGFFQIVNHGVPEKVIEEMKENIKGFFGLSVEEKKKIAKIPGDVEGYGQAFVFSEEQKLDWADTIYLFTQPPHFRNFTFWPSQPPSFRDSLERYSLELQKVAKCILGFMARNLGVNQEKLTQIFGSQTVRINYYPPCPNVHDKVLGLSPHSDGAGLILLLQVNPVDGLQVTRNGKWVSVQPLPGAFVVNIGDNLEILTNGRYKSIEHRATVNPNNERMSIAAFHSPSFGEIVGPLAETVVGDKERYKTMSMENYAKLYISSKLDGKSFIELMKLQP